MKQQCLPCQLPDQLPCAAPQMSWDVISCAPYTEGTIKMLLKEGGRQVELQCSFA